MSNKTLGIVGIILAILVALNHYMAWGNLQYLWALLLLIMGIIMVVSK